MSIITMNPQRILGNLPDITMQDQGAFLDDAGTQLEQTQEAAVK